MAEIVEYRLERTLKDLDLLIEFGLLNKAQAKEIVSKRENFEYALRKSSRNKLDFLKYIRFEVNLLESIEKYKNTIIRDHYKLKSQEAENEIERRILLLQAKKLNDVIRSSSSHISALFRKLTTTYQFDKKMWLAYIDFAKSRKWNTRVTALYWRLLRISNDDADIWIAAASYEVDQNKAYDTARGLYLKALRHHSDVARVWANYFKMELRYMNVVYRRAKIVFKILAKDKVSENPEAVLGSIWESDLNEDKASKNDSSEGPTEQEPENDSSPTRQTHDDTVEQLPIEKALDDDDKVISGHLPRVVYDHAVDSLKSKLSFVEFIISVFKYFLDEDLQSSGLESVKSYVRADIEKRSKDSNDERIPKDFLENCDNLKYLDDHSNNQDGIENPKKRVKGAYRSKMDTLYECYETKGIDEVRKLYDTLERSVLSRTLSLYVGMIQIELWQLAKEKSEEQLNRIRSIYDKALMKFGKTKPKLWYEYLQLEQDNAKTLDDLNRINTIYTRAISTLEKSKVDKVIEKYTLLQMKKTVGDAEYSDYSDLED